MFVTTPQYEQFLPDAAESKHQWWRAVTLFAASYWFLFVYEVGNDGERGQETALAFDEWTLFSLVTNTPVHDRRAICRFERDGSTCAKWAPRWLEALWASSPAEAELTGVVLLQLEGELQLRDARMRPAPAAQGRRLLFQAPRQGAQGG